MANFYDNTNLPFNLALAQEEIFGSYGDRVSIWDKRKTLVKFGYNTDVDTGTIETVWSFGGNETYVFADEITSISSSSVSDTGVVTVEGHRNAGTEANPEYIFVTQQVTLTGQTTAALTTPLSRVSRVFNASSTPLVGTVYVHEGGATTGGVPNDATTVHITIPAGSNQSFKAATTFSSTDYFIMTYLNGSVRKATSASVDFIVQVRQPGGVFRESFIFTSSQSGGTVNIIGEPYLIIPKNSDIRIQADSSTTNVSVGAVFAGYIAKVI